MWNLEPKHTGLKFPQFWLPAAQGSACSEAPAIRRPSLLLPTSRHIYPPLPGHLPSSPNISRCRLIVSFAITGVVIEDSIIMSPLLTPHWFEHDGWSLAELYFLWHHSIKPQLQMRAAVSSSRTHQLAVPCCGKALSPVD